MSSQSFRTSRLLYSLNVTQFFAAASIGFLITLLGINDTDSSTQFDSNFNRKFSSEKFEGGLLGSASMSDVFRWGTFSFVIVSLLSAFVAGGFIADSRFNPNRYGIDRSVESPERPAT